MVVVERRIYPFYPLRAPLSHTRRVHIPATIVDREGRSYDVAACSDTVLLRPEPTRHYQTPKPCQRCVQKMARLGLLP